MASAASTTAVSSGGGADQSLELVDGGSAGGEQLKALRLQTKRRLLLENAEVRALGAADKQRALEELYRDQELPRLFAARQHFRKHYAVLPAQHHSTDNQP